MVQASDHQLQIPKATEYNSLPYIPSQKMTIALNGQKGGASVWSSVGRSNDESATLPRKPKVDFIMELHKSII